MPQSRIRTRIKPLFLAVQLACVLPLGIVAQADQAVVQYDIGAGALGDVLSRFAAQAGIDLAIDGRLVAGLNSNGLHGSYAVEDGLRRLLAGSGYGFVQTGAVKRVRFSATRAKCWLDSLRNRVLDKISKGITSARW